MSAAGRLLRGRPASGGAFNAADYGTLVGWWKPESLSALADTDPVASWPDSSGNGRTLAQAAALQRPTYRTGVVNGVAVVRFVAARVDTLILASAVSLTALTVFVVYKTTGDNLLLGCDTNGSQLMRIGDGGNNRYLIYDGVSFPNSTTLAAARTDWNIGVTKRSGSTVSWYEAGTARSTGSAGVAIPFKSVGSNSGFTSPTGGDIAEIIVYSNALSDGNRDAVEAALGTKYAITVA